MPDPSAHTHAAAEVSGAQVADDRPIPTGFRQAVVTAVTVFLGFSLTLLRSFWTQQARGGWTRSEIVGEAIIAIGVLLEVASLFRALDLSADGAFAFRHTVTLFKAGVVVVVAGILFSIFVGR
jgi:hypothetical protein